MLATRNYSECPRCKSLNMTHRSTCYRCGSPISRARPAEKTTLSGDQPNRRAYPRYDVNAPGMVLEKNGEKRHDLIVQNIGVGGLMFDCDFPYQEFDRITLRFALEGRWYTVDAIVRHVTGLLSNEMSCAAGVEFLNPGPALIAHIQSLAPGGRETWG